ncbi:MAG: CDP-glycerol glycerophosphotransferase family protein, partial [Fusobacteria bacterium]|nr:CDP-glycerol glycerophosphotransferase family protein [Fusobacteriota bacterium]
MQNFLFFMIRCLSMLIPKSSKRILFISKPDFSDNAKIFYDYMKVNSDKESIWLCFDSKVAGVLTEKFGIPTAVIKSFKGIKLYFTTKYIVTSSGSLWQFKAKSQKQFDLWHGIPLKNIICLEDGAPLKSLANTVNLRFATSSLTRIIFSSAFHCFPQKIVITGQPRTDALFINGNLGKIVPQYLNYKKVVFYMPTYRKGYKNKKDGRVFNSKNIFGFEIFDFDKFEEFLKNENILLLIKLHPYEDKIFIQEFKDSSNIV